MKYSKIIKPIFIVGCGRSGTTLLYHLMAGHRDLAWISNYNDKFPNRPWLSKFNFLFKNPRISSYTRNRKRAFPFILPDEGYNFWDMFYQVQQPDLPLTESDVKYSDTTSMKKLISRYIKHSNSERFLNKNTRNTRRCRYLLKIFPDAFFIHTIRDGRAVTNSLINTSFWRNLPLWYHDEGKTPAQLIDEGMDEILLAAKLWKYEVERILSDSEKIPKEQYMEIRYETLTEKPEAALMKILSFCDLDWNSEFEKFVKSFDAQNRNYKWKQNFSDEQRNNIQDELEPLLSKLGYEFSRTNEIKYAQSNMEYSVI